MMKDIKYGENFLLSNLCAESFFNLLFCFRTPVNSRTKISTRLQPVLTAPRRHIKAWCMSRFYVKDFEQSYCVNGQSFFT